MIVFRWWSTTKKKVLYTYTYHWEGWFLFGFIPLFIKLVKEERH
jgi:hypothetical protein